MKSDLLSRRDLDFLLFEWLDVEALTKRPRFADHSAETFGDVLDLCEQLATRYFANAQQAQRRQRAHLRRHDGHGDPRGQGGLDAFAAAGLLGDGHGRTSSAARSCRSPWRQAGFAWFAAANISTRRVTPCSPWPTPTCWPSSAAPEQIDAFVTPMLAGRFFGTMCLSETQAGSSLADITTRAEPQDDGTYRLFGNKMWISGGDHELTENIVHLVLAKIPGGPAGTKGISLFIVPKFLVERRRLDRRAQRRGAGRAQPQDGLPRHHQHRAQLRRGHVHARRRSRARSAIWSASRTAASPTCST